jgi:hypothetical protein
LGSSRTYNPLTREPRPDSAIIRFTPYDVIGVSIVDIGVGINVETWIEVEIIHRRVVTGLKLGLYIQVGVHFGVGISVASELASGLGSELTELRVGIKIVAFMTTFRIIVCTAPHDH